MYKGIFFIVLILCASCLFAQNEKQSQDFYPAPKGGMGKFRATIYNNLRYPKDALERGIEGTVYVKFLVNKDGKVPKDSISIVHPLFPSLDKEAIRLISKTPNWIPKTDENGKPIKSWIYSPINFKIKNAP